jgi:transcriptional regulator GlxA family with amidase domain
METQMDTATRTPGQMTIGILIFDEVEVLDFCGPFEVFASATAAGESPRDERRLFRVLTIAEENRIVRARGGLLIQPHHTISDHPPLDILVVPGGFGTRRELSNPVVLDWIAAQDRQTRLTTSVCTGAFLLAANGLLDGKRATTHWASIEWLREHFPAIDVRANERVVDEGHIITSAGVSAGIDMALHVVARLHGQEVAAETARGMEYDWKVEPVAGSR